MNNKGNINKLYTGKIKFRLLAIIASLVIVVFGILFYITESKRIRNEKYLQLKTIADFKVNLILEWHKERLADASHFSKSPLYIKALTKYFAKPDTSVERDMINRNRMIKELRGFESVYIVSKNKTNYFLLDTVHQLDDYIVSMYIDSAFLNRKIYFTNFYYNPKYDYVRLAIISPIIDNRDQVIAFLIFLINPKTYLYPLVQTWPTPSKTSETLIVSKEGDSVIFINELRHLKNSALKLHYPLTNKDLPAVQAVVGLKGKFEGKDYRGKVVLSDLRIIPGTQWFMVTKIDKKEIFGELRFRAVVILIIIIIMILLLISGLAWIYNNHKSNIYKELLISAQQLNKIQEEFRITLYSVGDSVITTDMAGFIKRMNREAERLTGWTETEARGKPLEEVFRIINEDTRETIKNPINKILNEGMVLGLTNHILLLSRDGSEIPIADTCAPIKDDKGIIHGIVLVFKDQTREREAQKALFESQQRMADIIEFLPDAIFAIDLEGKVIAWNKAIQELTGVLASDILGKGDFEYALPFFGKRHPILIDFVFGDKPEQAVNYDLIKREGDTLIAESSICEVKGKRINFYGKASPLYNSNGEIAGAIELIRDITESKKNESLLREKDIIFQSLLEFSPIYVFFKDNEIRPIHLSRNYEKMLGMPLSQILGKTMDDIFPSDLAKSMIADDKKILFDGKLVQVDEELNGRYYTTIKFPINQDGQTPLLAGFTIDITDRKKAEQELILAKERAEKSDKLKEAFLQNMSHEIRTPLNAITGFAELLNDDDITKDKIEKFTSIICNSSLQLLSIVDDILTVSRIQTGQEVANIKPVNINTILNDLLVIFKARAKEKNLLVTMYKDLTDENSLIYTDRTKFTQILTNLLTNAIKFTHKGSIDFGYAHKADWLEFYVKDTGIGIKPETQELIFERFAQGDNNINKQYGGTGLGLSISKAYANILGGSVWVTSESEKGSVFYFNIPYKPADKAEIKTPVISKSANNGNKTILVAEDEENNYQLIHEILNNKYKILHAKNGNEAIELCRQNPDISVILMDIKMPDMDGYTAMTEIKKFRPNLPVIAQTAYAQKEDKDEFIKKGFDDYLSKPIKKDELIDKVLKYV